MNNMKIGNVYVMDAKSFREWVEVQKVKNERWAALMEIRREVLNLGEK